MSIINKRTIIGASLASIAVSGLLVMSPNIDRAHADAFDTCDASLITITKTDETTGEPLANARFVIRTPAEVYVRGYNAMAEENTFRAAYDGEGTVRDDLDTTNFEVAFRESSSLGFEDRLVSMNETFRYPASIEAQTDPVLIREALIEYASSAHFISLRSQIVNTNLNLRSTHNIFTNIENMAQVPITAAELQAADPTYFANLEAELAKSEFLMDQLDSLGVEQTLTAFDVDVWVDDFAAFNAIHDTLVDPDNWTFGTTQTPNDHVTDLMMDRLGFFDATEANAEASEAAATELALVNQTSVSTDENGQVQFTLIGVKNDAWEGGTRGDSTCSQLTAELREAFAPTGYDIDTTVHTVASQSDQTGSITITNRRSDSTEPQIPVRVRTGL